MNAMNNQVLPTKDPEYHLKSPFWHPLLNFSAVKPLVVGFFAALLTWNVQRIREKGKKIGKTPPKNGPFIAFFTTSIFTFVLANHLESKELEFQLKTEYLARRKSEFKDWLQNHPELLEVEEDVNLNMDFEHLLRTEGPEFINWLETRPELLESDRSDLTTDEKIEALLSDEGFVKWLQQLPPDHRLNSGADSKEFMDSLRNLHPTMVNEEQLASSTGRKLE